MVSRIAVAVAAVLALPAAPVLAQSTQSPDTQVLLKKLEEQERRIEALEKKLQDQQTANTASPTTAMPASAAAQNPAGAPTPSTAEQGATAAVAQKAANAAPSIASGSVKGGPGGFSIQSGDGSNVIRFRGNLAVDGRWYSDNVTPTTADTWTFRRVRPYIEGTVGDIYDFRFMPDFGNGKSIVVDAFVTGRFQSWLNIQAGKFKGPVGLERLQPDQFNRFMELSMVSDLVPNRDLGVQAGGDLFGGTLGYAIGYFDGVTDGTSTDANASPDVDNDGKKDTEGRLFAQPFILSDNPWLRGFGAGIAGTYVNSTGSATNTLLASYKSSAQQTFFTYRTGTTATYADGRRLRYSPQAYYYGGPLGVIAEYVKSSQEVSRQVSTALKRSGTIDNSAYQVLVSYFLTGEKASYNNFVPRSTFAPGKPGWGAWEIVARFQALTIDDDAFTGGSGSFADPTAAPRKATAIGVGLNWYLNQNIKWMFDYERTRFDGGATAGDRPDEKAILTRFSLIF